MKKIPYGIINFEKLITNNYLYVDKTMYLEKLENVKEILFYLKPGRFGKSLFTSMMFYYYDIKSKDKFDVLFKDTYVYKNPTSKKNSYYCLMFDFSGISMKSGEEKIDQDDLLNSFRKSVKIGIESFLTHYKYEYKIDETDRPDNILKDFLSYVNSLELDKKLYIIIDEYDNFTNAILEGDAKDFIDAVGNNGFVKSFYSVIKIFVKEGLVDRFFATGICPITLNSMTTGFNIASDISTDPRFNSMIGLTHAEVWDLLSEYDKKIQNQLFDVMMKNYDGYLFSKELNNDNRVFNATLTMYLLDYFESFKEIPENLVDRNITANYGKIGNLIKLQNNKYYQEILDSILKYGCIEGTLTNEFNLEIDFTKNDIISLLYYFGYLTIKEKAISGLTVFSVPNNVMKETYSNYFLKLLNDLDIDTNSEDYGKIFNEIVVDGLINNITEYVSEILKCSDNRIFMKFDEKYVQLLYFAFLKSSTRFSVYTEFPCSKGGYIDVMLIPKDDVMKHNIMIEIKYIKKGEFKKKIFEDLKNRGEEQLREYSKDGRINKNLKKYLVIFSGCDIKLLENVE